MPCYDPRPDEERIEKVNKLTRWLCQVMGALEAMGIDITQHDPELAKWWAEHKVFDKTRKGN